MAAGMIGRAIRDAGKAWQEAGAVASQSVKITVNEHNILKAAAIIEAEARRFRATVEAIAADMHVDPMGNDPVSSEAARVLNEKLREGPNSYVDRCRQRAEMLEQLADQLKEAARIYMLTEEQIESQFGTALQDALTTTPRPEHDLGRMRAV